MESQSRSERQEEKGRREGGNSGVSAGPALLLYFDESLQINNNVSIPEKQVAL